MMQGPQAAFLADRHRLHLQHGPIDLIVEVFGPGKQSAYQRATLRFETILQELADELPDLRHQISSPPRRGAGKFRGATARRMGAAVAPFAREFVTPMAAVAGAVADEILGELTAGSGIAKAYVNNGGDIAFHLGPDEVFTTAIAASPPANATLNFAMPTRGVATSGWGGRSHSLGIADSVTVLAKNAAIADAAATLIANAVDLPGHASVTRRPACDLSPDSDLGNRLVTVAVAPLSLTEKQTALARGIAQAQSYLDRDLIHGAYLVCQDETRVAASPQLLSALKEPQNA